MSRPFTHLTAVVIAAGLLAALLFSLGGAPPTLAQWAPASPDAPGSIAGTITDEAGAPVAGAEVQLFRQDVSGWVVARVVRSDATGAYRATLLATGAYRILVSDPAGVYAQSYYPNALIIDDAVSIMVAGADIAGIDVMLRRGGAITGVYSDTNPYTLYARIVALTRSRGLWQEVAVTWQYAAGDYVLTGLPPAVYRVCAYAPPYESSGPPQPAVCYRDIVSAIDNAADVTVTAGVTTTAIDLTVGVAGDGATIGGQVRAPAGDPLSEIDAVLFRQDEHQNVFNVGAVKTAAQGAYTFRGLRPGRYFMQFADSLGPYITTYYSATTWMNEATPIVVAVREERLDVDATLAVGGILTGALRILTDTAPAWAYVNLYSASASERSLQDDASDGDATQPLQWAKNQNGAYPRYYASYDPATGHYRINAVPPGPYYVYATAQMDQLTFSGFYVAADLTPRVVTVTAGAVLTDLDINLGLGAFEGVIAGRVTAGDQPLAGIKASLLRTESYGVQEIVHVFTGADGRYTIGGLMRSAYRMGFSDPAGVYATQYYSQAVHPDMGEIINLAPAEQRRNIDAALNVGGAMTGRITLDDNAPALGYTVHFFHELGFPPVFRLLEMPLRATTDATGAYRMAGLAAGGYRVCASRTADGQGAPRGCFGGPPLVYYPYWAEPAWVLSGEETANIDIDLGQPDPPVAYLPLLARQVSPTLPFSATLLVNANIRSCPSQVCMTINTAPAGTVVTVSACNDTCTWYEIGVGRWVLADVLSPQPAGRQGIAFHSRTPTVREGSQSLARSLSRPRTAPAKE
jgi:5-hydroxyisourate hydrolase-like protein (transthyretin family)